MSKRVFALALALPLICCQQPSGEAKKRPHPPAPLGEWAEVDKLIGEQKLEAASTKLDALRDRAQKEGRQEEWARALVKQVQLRMGLHGYETAVRFLREQPWPKELIPHSAIELYYAHALVNYLRQYGWEIGEREQVDTKGVVDLKAWTRAQIVAEAVKSYDEVWQHRAELGDQPVAAMAEFLQTNNYPAEVRGTLRDAVSYLSVELLADTSLWRPEESNEQYRIDFAKLLAGQAPRAIQLGDAALHPLERVGAMLDDLESWHAQKGQTEAALEARLERLRRLNNSFTQPAERKAIRDHLEALLPKHRQEAWWSMGVALDAELWRAEDLVRAHDLAKQGAEAFPKSPGGQICLVTMKSIEAPDYQLEAMSSDSAGKRSILVTHHNLAELHFRAWSLDLGHRIDTARDYQLLANASEILKLFGATRPTAEWTVSLPATPDYRSHKSYLTPPHALAKSGWYVIAASVRSDFDAGHNRIVGMNFIVSDLVLVTRVDASGAVEVRVVSGSKGRPAAGAQVDLYRYDWQKQHSRVDSKRADGEGLVSFSRKNDGAHFLVARAGGEMALDADQIYFSHPGTPGEVASSLVYTDRAIYRPTQKLFWKVVAYRGRADEGRYQVSPNASISVSLHDPNGQQVEVKSATTNAYGSAAGEFVIPTGRLLGNWTVLASQGGAASVRVEEYKRPTFEVSFKDGGAPMRLNRPASLKGEARYYFGLPVTAGKVRWRVTREPVYPWWWGWWGWGGNVATQQIAAGASPLGADGVFEVKFTPEADEKAGKELSYRYHVSADLTDEGGETRSAQKSVRLGFVSVEATLSAEGDFLRAGVAAGVTIRRTDLDGQPRAGKGSWKLLTVSQPETRMASEEPMVAPPNAPPAFHTPGDALKPRWTGAETPEAAIARWPDGAEKSSGQTTHGENGQAEVKLPPLLAGVYRLRYETVDDFGAKYSTWKDLVVAADQTPLSVPAALWVESSSVTVGGTARIFAHSGFGDEPLYFERYRAGKIIERRRLGEGRADLIELPIGEADRGGFGVALTAVRDHQLVRWTRSVMVPWDDKELEVGFSTFRDKLRPGQKETWRVTVKGPKGQKLDERAAEVLAYMYDRSLDLFGAQSPPSPLGLYPSRSEVGWARSNLGTAGIQWLRSEPLSDIPAGPSLYGDSLKDVGGYAIGGMGGRGFYNNKSAAMPVMAAAAPRAKMAMRSGKDRDADGIPDSADKEESRAESTVEKVPAATTPAQALKGPALRTNFSETAFWLPQLILDKEGSTAIEFTVPDSVTSWNVWVHAITKDLRGGSKRVEAKTVKELMVRPYLPRFFREGDQAAIKVVVNDAGDSNLSGSVDFDIIDPDTRESKLALFGIKEKSIHFTVEKGKGTNLTFPVVAPKAVGLYAFKVTAQAGNLSDGELRPVPVLPSRMHLMQSRFVTLRDADQRTMTFKDLQKNDDPTRINEQMVVTVDAQLFYTVLKALPYLIRYPYECTEQTLNRFVSTGIVTSLYKQYPAIAKMAESFGKRQTQFETFDAGDPNRKLALEETPFLVQSKGGGREEDDLIDVLDPRIARANRDEALAKLRKAQTSNGAFPWFPGGPPSPYMTLYIMHGFSKAAEFGVDVPKDVVQRGWQYLAGYVRAEKIDWLKHDCCWEMATFLNYVASSYPDPSWVNDALSAADRKELLDFSYRHWKHHSPYLKGMLALTLKRANRAADGKLVFDSVMDSAKSAPDQGTFWAQEDRSWLWYEDTIESHAFALRVLMELDPGNAKKDGLVLWLLLNKKLNHWKSTRATAEVLYSLAHYLKVEQSLGVREEAKVTIGSQSQRFVFEPEKYVGKAQLVLPGPEVSAQTATVTVEKQTKGFMFASATWNFSTDKLPDEERGDFFSVTRHYFKRYNDGLKWVLQPMGEGVTLEPGDELEVQLSLKTKHAAEYVHLRDPRAAGLEPENQVSRWKWDLGIAWYEEVRDSGSNFFFEQLPAGEYTFKYRLRASMGGTFRIGPATVQSIYAPEFAAYSAGNILKIK